MAELQQHSFTATYSWTDNATNETGVRIERKAGVGPYVQVGQVGAGVTTFVDTQGLALNEDYCYRAIAFNANGSAAPGAEVCGSTKVPAPTSGGVLLLTIAP